MSESITLRPTLAGFVHGIVGYRIDRALPAWDRNRYVYVVQCDGCGTATITRGRDVQLVLTSMRAHSEHLGLAQRRRQRIDDQLALYCAACCTTCPECASIT